MKNILIFIIVASSILLAASNENNESNSSKKESKIEEQIKKQMEKEQKYAKEQKFYQGAGYDTKSHEVDPNSLPDVPTFEPDYDFDMSEGVYSD